MATRDRRNLTVLFSDIPGDEEKVRAILADWGLEEEAVYRLLSGAEASDYDAWTEGAVNVPAPRGTSPRRRHLSH